jgi:hypothetical protein
MTLLKICTLLLVSGVIASGQAYGQNASSPGVTANKPMGDTPPGPPAPQALTAAELAKIKAVLAPYKSASLSVDDAKAIKRSLRDAGLRRSRELDAALNAAGFSSQKMDLLDPPPPRPPGEGSPPPPPPVKK